jgi:hypothetical protein
MAEQRRGLDDPQGLLIANYLVAGHWETSAKECLGLAMAPFIDPGITARAYRWLQEAAAVKRAIAEELGPAGVAEAESCGEAEVPNTLAATGDYRAPGKVSSN